MLTLAASAASAAEEIVIEGSDAAGLCFAMKRFAVDYPRAELRNFFVYIEVPQHQGRAQIAFVPHPGPVRSTQSRSTVRRGQQVWRRGSLRDFAQAAQNFARAVREVSKEDSGQLHNLAVVIPRERSS